MYQEVDEEIKRKEKLFANPKNSFIDDLLEEKFTNINVKREIYNITFSFPYNKKEILVKYLKKHGKKNISKMILEEAEKCQYAEVK